MKRFTILSTVCSIGLLVSRSAWAQAARTWVSGVGDDANSCSRTAPCRTFAGAIAKTVAGGEIDTLDPGGFGGVSVTKAITLADEGVGEGGVLVSGANGVTVNCSTDPNCIVVIRGLVIDGGPVGSNSLVGVKFIAGKTLIIENTTIRNFTGPAPNGFGIAFQPTATGAQTYNLVIENSTISTNGAGAVGSGSGGGVIVSPTGRAFVNVVVDHVRLLGNNAGLRVDNSLGALNGVNVAVSNSVISENVNGGAVVITANTSAPAAMSIDHSTVSQNNVGLNSNGSGSALRFGSSTVSGNATAFTINNGGDLTTYGNNQVNDNATLGATPTSSPPS